MRKIEQEMTKAIREVREWDKDNTKVRLGRHNGNIEVYLHGWHLATIAPDDNVYIDTNTIVKKPSKTTVSRLKALGVNARLIGNPGHPLGVSIDGEPVVRTVDAWKPRAHFPTGL